MHRSSSEDDAGTVALVERVLADSAALVRAEVALAREELRLDLAAAKRSAVLGAVAVVLALEGLASLCVALGVAIGTVGALVLGGTLLLAAAVLGVVAAKTVPTKPMGATTRRLEDDGRLLKEHLP